MSSDASTGRTDGRAARWAGQRDRRRREFVDAALRAIAEHGPEVSTEQVAAAAGVARAQLYKHFTDATDLRSAIAARVGEQLTTTLQLWELSGTPTEMIHSAVSAHVGWLVENRNLYRYLSRHSLLSLTDNRDPITDVRTAIARQLTALFEAYRTAFGIDTVGVEPLAYAIIGLVDSSAARWLESPSGMSLDELAALLTRWVWQILQDDLRSGGVTVDPDLPLDRPEPPA